MTDLVTPETEQTQLINLNINLFRNPEHIIEDKRIGAGGFGKVVSGYFKSLPIAIKILKQFNFSEFLKEIKILKMFKHPLVAAMYGVVIKQSKTENKIEKINLINELIDGDTFDKYLNKTNPPEIVKIVHLIELATVLTFLHSLKLIHRDLKPSNVMVDKNMNLKLLDFGISKISQNYYTSTLTTGTILYMSPENFSIESATTQAEIMKGIISTKVDVWAFGCMVSEIFSGYRPWAPYVKDDRVIMGLLYNKKNFMLPKNLTDPVWVTFVKDCTKVNPKDRPNMKSVREKLLSILYEKCKNNEFHKIIRNHFGPKHSYIVLDKIQKHLFEYQQLSVENYKLKYNIESFEDEIYKNNTGGDNNEKKLFSTTTTDFHKEFSSKTDSTKNESTKASSLFGDDYLFDESNNTKTLTGAEIRNTLNSVASLNNSENVSKCSVPADLVDLDTNSTVSTKAMTRTIPSKKKEIPVDEFPTSEDGDVGVNLEEDFASEMKLSKKPQPKKEVRLPQKVMKADKFIESEKNLENMIRERSVEKEDILSKLVEKMHSKEAPQKAVDNNNKMPKKITKAVQPKAKSEMGFDKVIDSKSKAKHKK